MGLYKLEGRAVTVLPNNINTVRENYYPRIQVQRNTGQIIFALAKRGSLTSGFLIGYLPNIPEDKKEKLEPIGTYWSDWEVCGKLEDYNEIVEITGINIANYDLLLDSLDKK